MINVTDKYINLATSESGAEIRYTLDGTDPSLSSTLYLGTMSLGEGQVLKARTFKNGSPASNITRYFPSDEFSYRVLGSIPAPSSVPGTYKVLEMGQGEYIACINLQKSFSSSYTGQVYVSKNLTEWTASPNLGSKRVYAAFKLKDNLGYAVISSTGVSTSADNDAIIEIYPDVFTNTSPTFSSTLAWTYGGRVTPGHQIATNKALFFQVEEYYLSGSVYYYSIGLVKIDDNGNFEKTVFGGADEDMYVYGLGYNPISNEILFAGKMQRSGIVATAYGFRISKDFGNSFDETQAFNNSFNSRFFATSDVYGNIYLLGSSTSGIYVNGKQNALNACYVGDYDCFASSPYILWSIEDDSAPYINVQNIFTSTGSSSVYLKYNTPVVIGCCPDENTILCTQKNEGNIQTDIIEVHIGPTSTLSSNSISTLSRISEPEWIPCKITYNTN